MLDNLVAPLVALALVVVLATVMPRLGSKGTPKGRRKKRH
jgi:hypothetical protein